MLKKMNQEFDSKSDDERIWNSIGIPYLRELDQKKNQKIQRMDSIRLKLPKTRISFRIEIRWIFGESSGFRNHFFHANRQKSSLDPLPKIQRISKKKNSREQQKNERWVHFENPADFEKSAGFLSTRTSP